MMIAIIGAGPAGISAARALVAAGRRVVVFDKSGGIGGRVATRRTERSSFDHGAPLLHGLPEELTEGAVRWRDGWVGVPGNSSLPRRWAGGIELQGRVTVTGLRRGSDGWRLAGAEADGFAAVLVAVPQPQAVALLGDHAGRFAGLEAVRMAPGWTLMAAFEAAVLGPDWRELEGPLAVGIRNSAKPGRDPGEAWVVHAAEGFARELLEREKPAMAEVLLAAFRAQTGAAQPVLALAHRWRYARTEVPLGRACLWDAGLGIGLAGDWCLGPDAGDAVASGRALAAAVLEG
jgi:predicted NAD/FAD-dependent oxidoreductase